MPTIRTSPTSLEFSQSFVWVPAASVALALSLAALGIFGDTSTLKSAFIFVTALFCLAGAATFAEQSRTTLDGASGKACVSHKRLRKPINVSFALPELKAVQLEHTGEGPAAYRVSLATSEKTFPLTAAFVSGDGPRRQAEQIQGWLAHQGLTVPLVEVDYPWQKFFEQ